MVKILYSKESETWSKMESLEVIDEHSFKLNLKNGDIRYFDLFDAINGENNGYHFNEYGRQRLKSMYEAEYFTKLDINCGVISWGGWIEILPEELYAHTVKWRAKE